MTNPFVTGLFGAWTMVQLAVGVFFLQAYAARRREFEYLLFALVCFALALTDAGLTLHSYFTGLSEWYLPALLTHMGAFLTTGLNVHFIHVFVGRRAPRLVGVGYAYSFACILVYLAGGWWESGSLHLARRAFFGFQFDQILAEPTVIGFLGYAGILVIDLVAVGVLAVAYSRGKREARGAVFGAGILLFFATLDVVNTVLGRSSPTFFPYAFLLYGFGVADTLIVRYRNALGELEVTTSDLRHTTEELTSSYLELSAIQEELFRKRRLASVGELAGSIAHEVRNPLAIIRNAAASLKRPAVSVDDQATLFGIIEEEVTRLNNLVAELLRYARPVNVQREATSLLDMVRSVVDKSPDSARVETSIPEDPEVETAWADANLLRLALSNILANAFQASGDGATVKIAVSPDLLEGVPAVRIDVIDGGHGMDPETARRALDPFFSTRPSGTGLGLPIAARIAEAHDGTLAIHSTPGEGTTVSLVFPSKRPERHSEPRLSLEPRVPAGSSADR